MAKLISSQVEQLREIGAYLRQVRQDQGIEIEDIANQIFIRPLLLRSLEEGLEEHLPEPVFVQGFIRRYADALGVDGLALAKEFSVTPVSVLPTPDGVEANGPDGVIEPETRNGIKVLAKAEDLYPDRRPFPWMLVGSVSALVVMVGLLGWGLSRQSPAPISDESPDAAPLTVDPEAEPEVPAATDEVPAEEAVTDAETAEDGADGAAAEPLEAPVVAEVNLTGRSWLSVTVDGRKVFEGILESGAQETWTAESSIVLTSGNAGGVEVSFNGDEAVPMGEAGKVETLTLTPDTDPEQLSQASP